MPISIERMKKAPLYSADGNHWQPLTKNSVFKQGITIKTGVGSLVGIAFSKISERAGPFSSRDEMVSLDHPPLKNLYISESTFLKIEKAERVNHWSWAADTFDEQIKLKLVTGSISGNTISSGANSGYEVQLTNGTVTFSNKTLFIVSASGMVYVVGGAASVFLADKNKTQEVSSGHTFDPETGIVTELSTNQIHILRNLMVDYGPEFEWGTPPPVLGHGLGIGGALRTFP
jgi:hypothetical protein